MINPKLKPAMRTVSENLAAFVGPGINQWDRVAISAPREPATPDHIYSDEALEYWGRIYLDNHFRARGVLFGTFMRFPRELMRALIFAKLQGTGYRDTFYPLLPQQRLAIARTQAPNKVQARSVAPAYFGMDLACGKDWTITPTRGKPR